MRMAYGREWKIEEMENFQSLMMVSVQSFLYLYVRIQNTPVQ